MAPASAWRGSLLLVAVAVAFPRLVCCYGATEIVLDLRTNLACETFQPKTQIRIAGEQIVAETATCESASASEAAIGTLTFVPSGDRNAKVVVEVVLAVKGMGPSECAAAPDKCIVARRTFSFIEHSSRRLPVLLWSQCLGKICGADETCVRGGTCVPIEMACQIEGCLVETAPPTMGTPPPPTVDSGTVGCTNGDVRCVGARLEECRDDTFDLHDLCGTPELCERRSGNTCAKSTVACVAGETKCEGVRVLRCRDDRSGFDTQIICSGTCSAVAGPARCITTACAPGERMCDSACSISGPNKGTSADDCLLKCNAGGTAFEFEQNCGIAQHGLFSDSCRPAPANGGAECF